ncbi:MAG: hypothetical protein ABSB19_05150 [Methylomonas sp.]|jgi:hypothetical protein
MSILSDGLQRILASEYALNASSFTPAQRLELDQFAFNTRLIEISKQGRSTLYHVPNRQSLIDFLALHKGLDENLLTENLPSRSRNIGLERNSKKGQSTHESCYLLMKSWNPEAIWNNETTTFFPADLTARFGVAAMRIGPIYAWRSNKPLLLVENQALFDRHDWLPEEFDGCLAYYAGQLSDVLIRWLSAQKRTNDVILFPDYDGVGLSNYVRLFEKLHPVSTLQFYWLPDWESKLVKFGNASIWLKTRIQFENAYEKLKAMNALTPELIRLAALSQHHGKALEQESIWL